MPSATVRWLLSLVVFSRLLSGPGAFAQYFETAIEPLAGEHFTSARYRIWLPPGVARIRGILVKQHGCGVGASSTGLHHADDLQWRALAQKHGMALLGTELTHDALCAQWFSLRGGSDRAFLRGLDSLAKQSNHPELARVPWALWGHSGGGYWSTEMLFAYPERILCALPRSGGISTMHWNPAVKDVPVMWMAGERDIVDGQDYVKALTYKSFLGYRRYGAPWGVAIDPRADHGNRLGRSFYIRWMDALLTRRLPETGTKPVRLDSLTGWLGNPATLEVKPFSKTEAARNQHVWLPDEALARAWREFSQTGWVTDSTPPPPPTNLAVQTSASGVEELVWQAQVDLESGLRRFNVFRNGVRVDSVVGQRPNFGDAPVPRRVVFAYPLPAGTAPAEFAVSAVNHQGLESPRSQPLDGRKPKRTRNQTQMRKHDEARAVPR